MVSLLRVAEADDKIGQLNVLDLNLSSEILLHFNFTSHFGYNTCSPASYGFLSTLYWIV